MTGYGRAENAINEKVVLVELRSLNGKQFELLLKLPVQLKPYEFEIRNMLSEQLVRGSIECSIIIKQNGATRPTSVNLDLAASYYNQIKGLAEKLEAESKQWDEQSDAQMHQHHRWAQATTVLQVAIAMAAIALLSRKKWLEYMMYVAGAGGVVVGVLAYLHI